MTDVSAGNIGSDSFTDLTDGSFGSEEFVQTSDFHVQSDRVIGPIGKIGQYTLIGETR